MTNHEISYAIGQNTDMEYATHAFLSIRGLFTEYDGMSMRVHASRNQSARVTLLHA
jgi:hypothetical protein